VPSTPAPARKRRRPNQDLQERLARCEELLKQYATTSKDSAAPSKPPPAVSRPLPPAATVASSSFSLTPSPSSTSSATPGSSLSYSTTPSSATQKPSKAPYEEEYPKWKSVGKVVVEDGSVTFMDNFLWANIYDEVSPLALV